MQLTKVKPCHPLLKQVVKYYWLLQSDERVVVDHRLLPMVSGELILNFSAPIGYASEGGATLPAADLHYCGVRTQVCSIKQVGPLDVLGVALWPGVNLLGRPVPASAAERLSLAEVLPGLEELGGRRATTGQRIAVLEKELVARFEPEMVPRPELAQALCRMRQDPDFRIGSFCNRTGISPRRLERLFSRQVGLSPKRCARLLRFQGILNQMLAGQYQDLTALGLEHGYYDQMHFIHDFKEFSGLTPSDFLSRRDSVKQLLAA